MYSDGSYGILVQFTQVALGASLCGKHRHLGESRLSYTQLGDFYCICWTRNGFIAGGNEHIPGFVAIYLAKALFSIPVHNAHQKQFAFIWPGQQYTCIFKHQGYISFLALHRNLVYKDLDHLSFSQDIALFYYLDIIMLIRSNEQNIPTTLDLWVRHLLVRLWKINLNKIHRPPPQWNIQAFSSMGHVKIFRLRRSKLYLTPPTTKKYIPCFLGLFAM